MNLATLSHEDLHTQSVGRAKILMIIIHSEAREDIPAPVMDDLTDWAREPVTEAVARADALMAQYRAATHYFDPAPDDLADKSIAAMRVELASQYVVCNRLLDAETNEHCEFDGDVTVTPNDFGGFRWTCPGCGGLRHGSGTGA